MITAKTIKDMMGTLYNTGQVSRKEYYLFLETADQERLNNIYNFLKENYRC